VLTSVGLWPLPPRKWACRSEWICLPCGGVLWILSRFVETLSSGVRYRLRFALLGWVSVMGPEGLEGISSLARTAAVFVFFSC
jgi:hypothetical protein